MIQQRHSVRFRMHIFGPIIENSPLCLLHFDSAALCRAAKMEGDLPCYALPLVVLRHASRRACLVLKAHDGALSRHVHPQSLAGPASRRRGCARQTQSVSRLRWLLLIPPYSPNLAKAVACA